MLERIAVVVETIALALWAGAMAGFAFIFAPIAFRTIGDMTTFATVTARCLKAIATFGGVCGALAIAASLSRLRGAQNPSLRLLGGGLICAAFAATAYETNVVLPAMDAAAARIGGAIDSVSSDDPRRVAYDAMHTTSTRVYGTAFLCVVAATALVAFGRAPRRS